MTDQPGLSIVLPVYQVGMYLRECLDSILQQNYAHFELILVDDGSTDESGEICDEYAQLDHRVRVIHQQNAGQSAARNRGIDLAAGRYIGFVDSDDWIDADMYQTLMHDAEANDADIACCGFRIVAEDGARRDNLSAETKETAVWEGDDVLLNLYTDFSPCNKIYRVTLFTQIRYPVGKLYEDARTTYRLAALTKTATMNYQQKYNYRQRHGSSMRELEIDSALDRLSVWDEIAAFMLPKFPDLKYIINARKNRLIFEYALFFANNGESDSVRRLRRYMAPTDQFFMFSRMDKLAWALFCQSVIAFTLAAQGMRVLRKLLNTHQGGFLS